jgi:hypothetical protein
MTNQNTVARSVRLLLFALLAGCQTAPTVPGFGNFGGSPRAPQAEAATPAYDAAKLVRWFPIQARFAPDGSWLVVNLCNHYNPRFCRIVRWEPDAPGQPVEGGLTSSGRWRLVAGQAPDKSYIWPTVSWDGKKLAFTVADCSVERATGWPAAEGKAGAAIPPPVDCEFFLARPAVSESVADIRVGYREIPIASAARPAWRPDDRALLYWRTVGTMRLASGRMAGARSLYEVDLATGHETHKLQGVAENRSWDRESASPHYATDGKRFRSCAFNLLGDSKYVDHGVHCFEVASNPAARLEVLNARGDTAFRRLYADWRGSHLLVEALGQLFLVERQTRKHDAPVLDASTLDPPGARKGSIINADIAGPSGDIVAIQGGLALQMQPVSGSGTGYYANNSERLHPSLIYLKRSAGAPVPVIWPNVEALNSTF